MKPTIKSLTVKGLSQKKIALQLHIRKSKVVAEQKRLRIGKRVASKFWEDVKSYRELLGGTHKQATEGVKHSPKWWYKGKRGLKRKAAEKPMYAGGESIMDRMVKRMYAQRGVTDMESYKSAVERGGS